MQGADASIDTRGTIRPRTTVLWCLAIFAAWAAVWLSQMRSAPQLAQSTFWLHSRASSVIRTPR
jgi:hypothetical protein